MGTTVQRVISRCFRVTFIAEGSGFGASLIEIFQRVTKRVQKDILQRPTRLVSFFFPYFLCHFHEGVILCTLQRHVRRDFGVSVRRLIGMFNYFFHGNLLIKDLTKE